MHFSQHCIRCKIIVLALNYGKSTALHLCLWTDLMGINYWVIVVLHHNSWVTVVLHLSVTSTQTALPLVEPMMLMVSTIHWRPCAQYHTVQNHVWILTANLIFVALITDFKEVWSHCFNFTILGRLAHFIWWILPSSVDDISASPPSSMIKVQQLLRHQFGESTVVQWSGNTVEYHSLTFFQRENAFHHYF